MSDKQTTRLLQQLRNRVQEDVRRELQSLSEANAAQILGHRLEDYNSWVLMNGWPDDVEKLALSLESGLQLDTAPDKLRQDLVKLVRDIYLQAQLSWPKIQAG